MKKMLITVTIAILINMWFTGKALEEIKNLKQERDFATKKQSLEEEIDLFRWINMDQSLKLVYSYCYNSLSEEQKESYAKFYSLTNAIIPPNSPRPSTVEMRYGSSLLMMADIIPQSDDNRLIINKREVNQAREIRECHRFLAILSGWAFEANDDRALEHVRTYFSAQKEKLIALLNEYK